MMAVGCWLSAADCWLSLLLLAGGVWVLIAAVSWLLAGSSVVTIVSRLLAVGCLLVVADWWLLGCPITTMPGSVWVLIVAVSGLLAGCWWLAGGCWCLGAGTCSWSGSCWVSFGKSSQARGEHTKGVTSIVSTGVAL